MNVHAVLRIQRPIESGATPPNRPPEENPGNTPRDPGRPVAGQPLPKYMPELDGLRAVAVGAVMLYHLNPRSDWFSLGWTGVVLFFVLSGFLITGILVDSAGAPAALAGFYARRALRILPIYYLSLVVVTIWAAVHHEPLSDLRYYLTYTQNYLLGATDFRPAFPLLLNHTWSLAVEQQFYVLWPLVALRLRPRRLLAVAVALLVLATALRALILFDLRSPGLIYTSLPTQMDSLAAGAALAILVRVVPDPRSLARPALGLMAAAGAVLLVLIHADGLAAFWHMETWGSEPLDIPFLTLLALLFSGLLAVSVLGSPSGLLPSLLRLALPRHLGRISYGLYMYHFPAYFLVDRLIWGYLPQQDGRLEQLAPPAAKLLLAYLLALASWQLIESPLSRLKSRLS